MRRPFGETPDHIILCDLEMIALLSMPLATADPTFDFGEAARILSSGEWLICGMTTHPEYEKQRAAFVQALVALKLLGYEFGRIGGVIDV